MITTTLKPIAAGWTTRGDALASKLERAGCVEWAGEVRSVCALLARHERSLHRLAEDDCNGHPCNGQYGLSAEYCSRMQAKWEERVERESTRIAKRCDELAARIGAKCNHGGDPRGAVLLIQFPGVEGDSWGRDGFVID